MRIPRIYTPQPLAAGRTVALEPAAARHLRTVLRLKAGDALTLFDGSGSEFNAKLESATHNQVTAAVGAARRPAAESPLRVTLAQGISRGERMDYTLQKAVELGVAEIIPLLTERSVVRLDDKAARRKQTHWQQLVIGACEQSGRVRVPPVQMPVSLAALCGMSTDYSMQLLLDPQASLTLAALAPPASRHILLLVGPEGGLSEAECGQAQAAGLQSVRLGPRVLRTETAALVALSLLQARWGDLG